MNTLSDNLAIRPAIRVIAVLVGSILLLGTAWASRADAAALNPGERAAVGWTFDGQVSSIGPLHRLHRVQMTPRKAIRLLGRAKTRTSRYGDVCNLTWKRLGLRLTFATFGKAKPRRCPKLLQSATISNGSEVGWQTQNGLGIGAPVTKLEELFPDAYLSEYLPNSERVLVDHAYGYGDGPSPTVMAVLDESLQFVNGFRLYIGQAGD